MRKWDNIGIFFYDSIIHAINYALIIVLHWNLIGISVEFPLSFAIKVLLLSICLWYFMWDVTTHFVKLDVCVSYLIE
jgi:uncharacterized membrane protein